MAITIKNTFKSLNHKLIYSGVAVILLIALVLAFTIFRDGKPTRAETYKDITGNAAGLQATITYDARCDTQPCIQTYDFNVYILRNDGQQVGVVRPDKDGKVNMALPEGSYVMLVGKQFGENGLFPQEKLTLKNGQQLELTLHYKEEAS